MPNTTVARRGRPSKDARKIISGGYGRVGEERQRLDIILQSPEIFHFDIRSYMSSLEAASAIDCYSRARLYDIYSSALLDLHLSGVISKRLTGVSRIRVEFRRDGKPDDTINMQLRSPWFRRFVKDLLWSKFWGFSLFQFGKDSKGWITYDLIDRKHFDPVRREILRYETDNSGAPLDAFENTLLVSEGDRELGLLAKIVPYVLYKRGNVGDWAQFCQVFGMPIREYTYPAGDEEARRRLLQDARRQGGNAVYIHPKDSDLNIIEPANKSGTNDLYERFCSMCNTEMSIAVLGNTLTTDAKATGTQALGTVHKEEEDEMKEDDRDFILDCLNYDMTDVFSALGFNTDGGEFVYVKRRSVDPTVQINVVEKLNAIGLPISDDYLYDTFDIDKPEDYDARKEAMRKEKDEERQRQEDTRKAIEERLNSVRSVPKELVPDVGNENSLRNRLRGFFGLAPLDGADPLPF